MLTDEASGKVCSSLGKQQGLWVSRGKKSSDRDQHDHGWPVTHAVKRLDHTPSRVGGSASKKYSSSRGQDTIKHQVLSLGLGMPTGYSVFLLMRRRCLVSL